MVLTGMKKISVLIALGMLMIAPWGWHKRYMTVAKLTGKIGMALSICGYGWFQVGALEETYSRWGLTGRYWPLSQ